MNRSLLLILFALVIYSCSTTKSLEKGEVLYTGSTVKYQKVPDADGKKWNMENASNKLTDLYLSLWDAPNGSLFGQPFLMVLPTRLWLYNMFYTKDNSNFDQFMRKNFGERAITIRSIMPELKIQKAMNVMENYGHFGTRGDFEIHYNSEGNKARIKYKLLVPPAYHYRNIIFENDTSKNQLNTSLLSYEAFSLIKSGDEFNLENLKKQRANIWEYLQNHGYYYLLEDDIRLEADSTVGRRQLDLRTRLANDLGGYTTVPQTIGKFEILIGDSGRTSITDKYYDWESGKMRKSFLQKLLPIKEGELYSLTNTTVSQRNISELGIFSGTNLRYSVAPDDTTKLNATLRMEPLNATSLEFNIKGNYENVGYLGPSIGLNINQLNLFGGGENLSINTDAYYDFPTGVYRERLSNSSGFSVRSALTYPWLQERFKFINSKYALPKQFVKLNFDFNDRKDYFRLFSWNAGYGFNWKSGPRVSHRVNLVDITFSHIYNPTELFDTIIAKNPSLRESMVNQLILGSGYTFTYDGREDLNKRVNVFFEGSIDFAGNTLNALHSLLSDKPEGDRNFLGLRYSQFTRIQYDFRLFWNFSPVQQLAFRHMGGIGFAYGNSTQMPYIRQFYIGGTNSLRPISARVAGPGRYIEFDRSEVNQVGTLKMEWNLEYRFKLFWKLHGALWSDFGNIWLLKDDPARPNAKVRWNHLAEDSYLTAGVGARLHLSFVIVRFDYGAILYIPVLPDGYRWLWQNKAPFWYPVISFGLPF